MGGAGETTIDLSKHMGIVIDQDGYIYISDSGNNRIKKYTGEGQFIIEWRNTGTTEVQLNYPVGMAVDSRDNIFNV